MDGPRADRIDAAAAALPAGPRPPESIEATRAALAASGATAVVLVEGWSDQAAVQALARQQGRDLAAEGLAVIPVGGITNMGPFAQALGPHGLGLRLSGLCDAAEADFLADRLQRLGLAGSRTRDALEGAGFFVCDADLEDELIRALGPEAVEAIVKAEGEWESLRRFQAQPAQRGRSAHAQLRRFMGTRARRKIRYGTLLVEGLQDGHVPAPLARVLALQRG